MIQKNARKQLKGLLIAGVALGISATASQAQGGFGGRGGEDRADYRQLTQEQRQKLADQVREFTREQMIRLMLSNAGFAEKTVQDEVIAFAKEQNTAMDKFGEQNRKMFEGMRGQDTSAAQLSGLMNEYRAAQETETSRRKTALDALDAKINFRKQPRLEAVLTTMGIVGDEMAVAGLGGGLDALGGGLGGFGGLGGRGGFGGFGGGDFGGRGGFGGDRGGFGGRGFGGDQGGNRGGERGGDRGGRGGFGGGERGGNRDGNRGERGGARGGERGGDRAGA